MREKREKSEYPLSIDMLSICAPRKLTKTQRGIILSKCVECFQISSWFEQNFTGLSQDVPNYGDCLQSVNKDERLNDAELVSEQLRTHWHIGGAVISNMLHLLESKGVMIFSVQLGVKSFSCWWQNKPFIFLNDGQSFEKARFDLAHELGHLVMHKDIPFGGSDSVMQEKEANHFAVSFLMPSNAIIVNPNSVLTVDFMIKYKEYFGVPIFVFLRRLRDLGLIEEYLYREVKKIMINRGFDIAEPSEKEKETSLLFKKVFLALRLGKILPSKVAHEIGLTQDDIQQVTFNQMKMLKRIA